MIKKLLGLGLVLLTLTIGISALERAQLVREYVAGKLVEDDNEKIDNAIRAGNVDAVNELIKKPTVDACSKVSIAYDLKKYEVLKAIANWCCCQAKLEHGYRPPTGPWLVEAIALSAKELAQKNSEFLPPKGSAVLVYEIKPDGSLQENSSFNSRGGAALAILDNGEIAKVNDFFKRGGGEFPADAVIVTSTILGNKAQSIFQYAQRLKNIALLEALLGAGANINFGAGSGVGTPLHAAVADLDVETVRFLIGAGADVNAIDVTGATPLHILVARAGSPAAAEIAQELINAGADKNVTDKQGRSPIVTVTNVNTQAVAEIIEQGQAVAEEVVEVVEEPEEFESVGEIPEWENLTIHVVPSQQQQYQQQQQYAVPERLMNVIHY